MYRARSISGACWLLLWSTGSAGMLIGVKGTVRKTNNVQKASSIENDARQED